MTSALETPEGTSSDFIEYPWATPISPSEPSGDLGHKTTESATLPYLRPYVDVLAELGDGPEFLMEGMIHDAATLVWGKSEQGKSSLLQCITRALACGEEWHGHGVPHGPVKIAVFASDPGGVREWCERLREIGTPPTVSVWVPPRPDPVLWRGMARDFQVAGVRLVIVDNFYSWVPDADVNKSGDVGPALACLGELQRAGLSVVLVHHADKGGTSPAGTHAFTAWFRHQVKVSRNRVVSQGNQAKSLTYRPTWLGWQVASLTPLSNDVGQESAGGYPATKGKLTKIDQAEQILRALSSPPENVSEAGRILAAKRISPNPDAGRKMAERVRDERGYPI